MPIYKDVLVNISKLSQSTATPNYGKTLLLTTESTTPYKEYTSMQAVAVDFQPTTSAYKMASAVFGQEPRPDMVAIAGVAQTDSFSDIISGLDTIIQQHEFYYLVTSVTAEESITQLATWATTNKVMYIAVVPPSAIDTIQSPNSDYAVFLVHDVKDQYADAAFTGVMSTFSPGSATGMFKNLIGITPVTFDDQNTMVELINSKNFMTYVSKYGRNMTTGGFTTSGEYIDIILGINWIQAEMERTIQLMLMNTPKVPYNDSGIALIVSQVEYVLKQAAINGILRQSNGIGQYSINFPALVDVPIEDIEKRIQQQITFEAFLAGAIHKVIITGTVMY